MKNTMANEFVKNLVAAFSRFPTSKDTSDLYCRKLAHWNLNQAQCDRAVDILISEEKGDNLPSLNDVYAALKTAQYTVISQGNDYGFMYFELQGKSYAVRLVRRDGIWISSKTGKFFNPPTEAENVIFVPDRPDIIRPEDMPTEEERKVILTRIWANLERMGR